MKFLIKLILVQVIAVIQSPIERALNDWTSTHYNWWPELLYRIVILIVFGLLAAFLLAEWAGTSRSVRIVTMILGIFNLVVGIYAVASLWRILTFSLIMIGVYLYFGISLLRQRNSG